MLHKRVHGQIVHCFVEKMVALVGFTYVDDCNLIISRKNPHSVLTSMQSLINSFCPAIEMTGGTVMKYKNRCYSAQFSCARGKRVARDVDIGLNLLPYQETYYPYIDYIVMIHSRCLVFGRP